jgi:hypothetical protein
VLVAWNSGIDDKNERWSILAGHRACRQGYATSAFCDRRSALNIEPFFVITNAGMPGSLSSNEHEDLSMKK